ncbi:hypothetical protein O9G_001009 [Rozella allomycis CSF55]|uniref:Uncharacterized protein n=1 Tax=Rozella allomycis (strain CSF55) TaxID=988480 RepID=A0A075AN17_ROZAC|nr:hypothetical protein O9G_001009 [Rozella allomycis CSF55]|eukprot:EPZ31098.1 hypothetical protein O9G_001009 [Rozella allomycis CSF55]
MSRSAIQSVTHLPQIKQSSLQIESRASSLDSLSSQSTVSPYTQGGQQRSLKEVALKDDSEYLATGKLNSRATLQKSMSLLSLYKNSPKDVVVEVTEQGKVLDTAENIQSGFEGKMDFQALWMAYSDLKGDYKDLMSMLSHYTRKASPGNYNDYLKLQNDLHAAKSLIEKFEHENAVLLHSNESLVESLEKGVSEESVLKVIRDLRLSLEAKRDVCVGYAKEKQSLEEKLGAVERKMLSLQAVCLHLEESKKSLEQKVSQLKDENDENLKNKWANESSAMKRSKSYESGIVVAIEADFKRKEISKLEFKIDSLERDNKALKQQSIDIKEGVMVLKDALNTSLEKNSELETQVKYLQCSNKNMTKDGELKNSEIEKLKTEVKGIKEKADDDINLLNKRIIELSMEKEMLEKKFESDMDAMIGRYNNSNEEAKLLEEQVVEYVKSTDKLNEEITSLKKSLKDEVQKGELTEIHNSELESELAEKNMEINVMKNEIIELKSQNEVKMLKMSEYAASIEKGKQNEQKYQMELAKKDEEMEIKEKHFNAKLDAMNEDLRNRESLIEKNESILFEEQERARKLQERVNDLEQRIVERNILIDTKDNENINLRNENESIRNKLIDANKETELLSNQIKDLSEKNNKLTHEYSRVSDELNEANLANERLNMNLKDVNKKYNQSINEVESLKIQNNELKTKEIYYNDAIKKLNGRENELEKILVTREQDIENSRKEIIEKNVIINEQTNKINYFEHELEKGRASFTDRFEKLVAENEQIKQEYENKIEISMQKMYELLELKSTIENELNTKMVELERQQDEINDCKHNLALKSNELLKAENEVLLLKLDVDDRIKLINELNEKIDTVEKYSKEIENQYELKLVEIKELNEKLLIAESEKEILHPEFENQLHDIKKLNEEQVEKLKSSIALLKEENGKLKEEVAEFRQRVNELSCNKADLEDVQEKLKRAEDKSNSIITKDLKIRLNNANNEISDYKLKLEDLNKQLAYNVLEANKLKSELKSLKESEINELNNISTENQKLQLQLETLSIENKDLKSMLDELSQEAEVNLNQRKKLNTKIKELENQIEKEKPSFRSKEEYYNKELKETKSQETHELTKLKERLNNLEELNLKKDRNVKSFLKNEAILKNALLNRESQMKSIANTISHNFKANFIKLKDQYSHIKNQLIIKENDILSLQKELQEKEALLVDKENSLEKTNAILNENNELKTQIEALKVEEEALKKKVYNDQFELRSYKEKATYFENKLVVLKEEFDKTNKDCINTISGMFKEIGKPQLAVPYNYFSLVEMIDALLNEIRDQKTTLETEIETIRKENEDLVQDNKNMGIKVARMFQKLNSAESALTSETQTFQEKLESLLQDNVKLHKESSLLNQKYEKSKHALNGYAAKLKREVEGRNEIINQVNQRAEADINEIKAKYEAYMQKMIYIIGKDNDSALASVLKELELYKREYNILKDKIKNRKRNQQQKDVKESPQSLKITEPFTPQ